MKKSRFFLQFILISLLFVILPITESFLSERHTSSITPSDFGIWNAVTLCLSLVILFQIFSSRKDYQPEENIIFPDYGLKAPEKNPFTLGLFYVLIVSVLIATGLVFTLLENLTGNGTGIKINFPEKPVFWFAAALNYLCGALFEECIFRLYLPYGFSILTEKRSGKAKFILTEILPLLMFAAGHFYLGFTAVLNALVSGISLRYFTLKTRSISITTASHFTYNFLMLIFIYLQEA